MALETIEDALGQYNANLNWNTDRSAAQLALEALRFLAINRPVDMTDQGTRMVYQALPSELAKLEGFLGGTAARAFGRKRRVAVSYNRGVIG